jgi:hypothetical protein
MIIDLKLESVLPELKIGKTPFGMIGVRMAKSIGVHDGGGRIINSNGQINEEEVFWKSARWVDYSGQIANGVIEGLTLMPAYFTRASVLDDLSVRMTGLSMICII